MKLVLSLPPLLLLLTTTATTTTTTTPPTTTNEECIANLDATYENSSTTAVTGVTELGIKLLRELGKEDNILISPYSIWSVLAMVLVGAEGQTEADMVRVLGLPEKAGVLKLWRNMDGSLLRATLKDRNVSLDLANRLYIHQGFSIKNCEAELSNLLVPINLMQKFEASKTINEFVNSSTRGLIPEIIKPEMLTPLSRMVVLNAVYFKGSWRYPFPKSETAPRPFHVTPDAKPVMVDMMYKTEMPLRFGYSMDLRAQIIQLPYSNGPFSMSILLPKDKGVAGFKATLDALNSESLWDALGSLYEDQVDIQMPKFEIKSEFVDDLKLALETLGLHDLFTLAANLTSFHKDLYVKHIVHKTVVKVSEEGTEAAAATGGIIDLRIKTSFIINRPFLFIIHTNDTILFIGAYKKP